MDTRLGIEIERRRTFAIISHPDAGKTTLTEKLLLYGGAIHLAGAVKAKKDQKYTTSDWMELEKQRGISISTTVLQFEYERHRINLLDTPGHKDFSEDTYRTLMAVDSAVMLIDAAKGVEPQTRKLFEVCRLRGIPIFTFINKMDRPSRDPMDLLDEIEKVLGIRSSPVSWPIGSGDRFKGVYDRNRKSVLLFGNEGRANVKERLRATQVNDFNDPMISKIISPNGNHSEDAQELLESLRSEVALLETAGDVFDPSQVARGELTPVFFGSALNNFGVEHFLETFIEMAPCPGARRDSNGKNILPDRPFSAFVFKIQANMDPAHRDRVAFMRVCSERFTRGVTVTNARSTEDTKLSRPLQFFGQERVVIDEAWPGDIIGMVDTSSALRIGDSLYVGERVEYEDVPVFSPEHFASVLILDPMKRKQLKKGLDQLSEEGIVQVYSQPGLGDKDPILGAVGALQLEVLKFRLELEYGVNVKIERLPFIHARWVVGEGFEPHAFGREDSRVVTDHDGNPLVLFKTDWGLGWAREQNPKLKFLTTAPRRIALC